MGSSDEGTSSARAREAVLGPASDGAKEAPRTDELLERLKRAASVDAYLEELPPFDLRFTEYLNKALSRHGVTVTDVKNRCGFNGTHCYQVFSGSRGCDRDRVILLALAYPMDLEETQQLLSRAGYSRLWAKDPRDAIVIFGIEHGQDRFAIDEKLYEMGFQTLCKVGAARSRAAR